MGKVAGIGELKSIRAELRRNGKKVVFTNGVFDLIHRGHIEYLSKAKALGDVLIVGVNDDGSVRRIKGSNRPVVNETDRAYIVANLAPVDYACLFAEDTPLEIISALVPDVLVKGADYSGEQVVGADFGQCSLHLANGRPAGIHDEYRAHAVLPLHRVLFSHHKTSAGGPGIPRGRRLTMW